MNSNTVNKLKNRIPYLTSGSFALVIKLANIKLDNYTVLKDGEPHIDTTDFKIYFISICLIAMIWDLIHTMEATILLNNNDDDNDDNLTYEDHTTICHKVKKIIKKILFCCLSLVIALLLFITFTNILTNGLPFYIFFGFTNDLDILIYGIIIPLVYILNIIEETYLKKYLDAYMILEKKDDINETSNLFGSRHKKTTTVSNII
jgi:hypothetical protein